MNSRKWNVNSDEIYQYIKHKTGIKPHIRSASMTSIGLGLSTNAIVRLLHAAYQSELQWRKSMEFKWKYYNEMDNGYGAHKIIWKRQWRKLKLKSKWSSPCTYQKEMWILYDHAAKHLDTLEQHYGHSFEWEASRRFKQEFGRALESGKKKLMRKASDNY